MELLLAHGWVHTYRDLSTLRHHSNDIIRTEGLGMKSLERLLRSIERSRHCTLAQFISSIGIPMVGRHAGRDLDQYFHGSWEAFEQAIQDNYDFTQLPGFGETVNNNAHAWYADQEAAKLWHPLLDCIEFKREDTRMKTNTDNPFNGKKVVTTGKMQNYTRDEIQTKLMSLGAKALSSK